MINLRGIKSHRHDESSSHASDRKNRAGAMSAKERSDPKLQRIWFLWLNERELNGLVKWKVIVK